MKPAPANLIQMCPDLNCARTAKCTRLMGCMSRAWLAAAPAASPTLESAARAVLERWDSPAWKWGDGPTADLMHAMRQALEASPTPQAESNAKAWMVERFGSVRGHPEWRELIEAFKAGQAAQPAQVEQAQPVAWLVEAPAGARVFVHGVEVPTFPLGCAHDVQRRQFVDAVNRASPPKAEAQPLSESQVMRLFIDLNAQNAAASSPSEMFTIIVRAIEAAHGIATKQGEK